MQLHPDLGGCFEALGAARCFSIETGGSCAYGAAGFEAGDALIFGSETAGLPPTVLAQIPRARQLMIPMRPGNRSLNLR